MTVKDMTEKFTLQYQASCETHSKIDRYNGDSQENPIPPNYLCAQTLLLVFWKPFFTIMHLHDFVRSWFNPKSITFKEINQLPYAKIRLMELNHQMGKGLGTP